MNREKTKKEVLLLIPNMVGGGAERVAAQLANEFERQGCDVTFILTNMSVADAVNPDLNKEIPLVSLSDKVYNISSIIKVFYALVFIYATIFCKLFEKMHKPVPAHFAYSSFVSQNYREIKQLRSYLEDNPNATAIAFLQPTIPITLLAARGLPNKIVFSERGDPIRLMKHRYGKKFIKKYYNRANAAVFQTYYAKNAYPENIAKKGIVISNPIKRDLPEAYHGERNKTITTFCRISPEKRLDMLVDAFGMILADYPQYNLKIIGNATNAAGEKTLSGLKEQIRSLHIEDAVLFLPFSEKVHEEILKDSMYVNSSEMEGLSNAMLEAMAMGMPSVCTDCPIGGARATIKDGENGLLAPVNDAEALYRAMKRVIEEDGLGEKLSLGGEKIREELSLEKTAKKWMELL